jgi:hypothetical protein
MMTIAGTSTAVFTLGGLTLGVPLIAILMFLLGGPIIALGGGISAAMGVSCMSALVNIIENLSLGGAILLSTVCGGA